MNNKNKVRQKAYAINDRLKELFPHADMALKFKTPWQCMVAVQLSAQCTDKKVNEVTQELFKKYQSLDDYVNADRKEFEQDIKPTGFYHNKAKHILEAAKMVKRKFDGKLPRRMEEITMLPGVGRKTANVVLGNVYGITEGIAVDTHVKRLSRQWGLTKQEDPGKIEQDLMEVLPEEEWFGWTYRVIEYGRTYSPARKKDHTDEPLAVFYV